MERAHISIAPPRFRVAFALLVAATGLFARPLMARAEITVACAANFTSRVSVEDKVPNAVYSIWVAKTAIGPYTRLSAIYTIPTDADGDGTIELSNATAGSLFPTTGHRFVKIGNPVAPSAQDPAEIEFEGGNPYWPGNWFASLTPGQSGPHTIRLRQAVQTNGGAYLETWDAGTVISLKLNAIDAKWVNMGAAIVPHGDLSANIVSVTDSRVTVQINGDPTHTTIDDLEISGVGINVLTAGSVGVDLEWTGSSSQYINGVLVGSTVWAVPQSYEFARYQPTTTHSAPMSSGWGIGLLTLCLMVSGTVIVRRNQSSV